MSTIEAFPFFIIAAALHSSPFFIYNFKGRNKIKLNFSSNKIAKSSINNVVFLNICCFIILNNSEFLKIYFFVLII